MTTTIIAALAFVGVVVLTELIGAEVSGWLPVIARAVVRLATRRLAPEIRARHLEEWLHDVDALAADRKLSALAWSLRICFTAHGIRRDLRSDSQQAAANGRLTYRRISLFFMILGTVTVGFGIATAIVAFIGGTLPTAISWPLSGPGALSYLASFLLMVEGVIVLATVQRYRRFKIPGDAWLKVEYRLFPPRLRTRLVPPARVERAAPTSQTSSHGR